MLELEVETESVTAELHPKGKHVRVRCTCETVPPGVPCAHVIEALSMFLDDFEGDDAELDAFADLFEGPNGTLAEEIGEYVAELASSLAGVSEAERELEKGRRERDRQQRQMNVEFGRDEVREAKGNLKESEKDLRGASRRLVRLVNGLGKTGRVPAGWPSPGVTSEQAKEFEAEYLARLREDAQERARKAVETSTPASSGGCGAAASLILVAVLVATALIL